MQQPEYILQTGVRVRTASKLETTAGMLVSAEYLEARRPNTEGAISGVVGGHGGDVYWVTHVDGTRAAYCYTEFDPIEE